MSEAEPDGGGWSRTGERSNALALWLISRTAVVFGRTVARWFLVPITLYFLLFAPEPRRHSRRYLERALGRPVSWVDVWRHFHRFSATVLDRVYFLRNDRRPFQLDVAGVEELNGVLSTGRGAFLVGGHLGSFEALGAAGRAFSDLHIAMCMFPDNARRLNAALRAIAPNSGLEVIALGQSHSTLAIRDNLDKGGLVGVLADRMLPGSAQRAKVVAAPFLGRQAMFSDGPFRLAQVLRRPVVFMVGLYNGGASYDARLALLADFSERASDAAGREEQVRQATLDFAAKLEALCLESPYNWFNFHDFWGEDDPQAGAGDLPADDAERRRASPGHQRVDGPDGSTAER